MKVSVQFLKDWLVVYGEKAYSTQLTSKNIVSQKAYDEAWEQYRLDEIAWRNSNPKSTFGYRHRFDERPKLPKVTRSAAQSAFGENGGDLVVGAANLGTSVVGLAIPVIREGARSLFRNIPGDFVPAINQTGRIGFAAQGVDASVNIIGTTSRVNSDCNQHD